MSVQPCFRCVSSQRHLTWHSLLIPKHGTCNQQHSWHRGSVCSTPIYLAKHITALPCLGALHSPSALCLRIALSTKTFAIEEMWCGKETVSSGGAETRKPSALVKPLWGIWMPSDSYFPHCWCPGLLGFTSTFRQVSKLTHNRIHE